jgi:hypothetical protein
MNSIPLLFLFVGLASLWSKPLIEKAYGEPNAALAHRLSIRALLISILFSENSRHGWIVFTSFSLLFVVASLYSWWTPFLSHHPVLYLTPLVAGVAASRWNQYAVSRAVAAAMGFLIAGLWLEAIIGDLAGSVSSSASSTVHSLSDTASNVGDSTWKWVKSVANLIP